MKSIIRFITAAMAILALAACGASGKAADQELSDLAATAFKTHDATIEVNYIYPLEFPARPSTDGYTITIKDGKMKGFLPFFGSSSMGGYSPNDGGFTFEDCPVRIKSTKGNDSVVWNFEAKAGTDNVRVSITIWNNGNAEIYLQPTNKSAMRYSGELR